jgi:DNA repair exonuclease SbcCD ATPase subunit
MPEIEEKERITIQSAAEMLEVPEDSIAGLIAGGLLRAEREGSRTYVSMEGVKALEEAFGARRPVETVTMERERYESMLIELGELRKQSEFLSECRSGLQAIEKEFKEKERELEEIKEILLETEWKDYELDLAQKRIFELEIELKNARSRSWWKGLFG